MTTAKHEMCATSSYCQATCDRLAELEQVNDVLLAACRLALGRLQNPLLNTSLFDDVKTELRKAILEAEGTPDA